jgi:hypothetical protein
LNNQPRLNQLKPLPKKTKLLPKKTPASSFSFFKQETGPGSLLPDSPVSFYNGTVIINA